ncbi:microfibril-associated glycoprotein 4 [Procambarus clarkii]|uniref:microfibril-associated glycoprotein 4 n=1 Tax=Procambarus clarkii TaxID=6728 RepID=UPI001E672716|nr:techylectin-5B-like [Procambarus clarkii]
MATFSCVFLLTLAAAATGQEYQTLREISNTLLLNQLALSNVLAERDSGTTVIRKWLSELQSNLTSELAAMIREERTSLHDTLREVVRRELDGVLEGAPTTRDVASSLNSYQPGNHSCLTDRPADCLGYRRRGFNTSGVFNIYPGSCCQPVTVWCDMTTEGGGWVIMLARGPQMVQENFARLWEDYKTGFGNPHREYWIGNEVIHRMTEKVPTVLRIDAEDFEGNRKFGEWRKFSIANETELYRLSVGDIWVASTLRDDLAYNNQMAFTTLDRDNDNNKDNCAKLRTGGGWWYKDCSYCTPNSLMIDTDHYYNSSTWYHWNTSREAFTSLRWLQLKFRPLDSQGPSQMCAGQ